MISPQENFLNMPTSQSQTLSGQRYTNTEYEILISAFMLAINMHLLFSVCPMKPAHLPLGKKSPRCSLDSIICSQWSAAFAV